MKVMTNTISKNCYSRFNCITYKIFTTNESIISLFVDEERVLECWICYDPDRTDVGPMINPCKCRGDVSAVHHDCLQRWLMEVSN